MEQPTTTTWAGLIYAIVLAVVGVVLLWWGQHQFEAASKIASSTFSFPVRENSFVILINLAAGVAFGLSLSAGLVASGRDRKVVVAAAVPPLLVVAHYYAFFVFEWVMFGPEIRLGLLKPVVVFSSAVVVGVALALAWPTRPGMPSAEVAQRVADS